MKHKYLIVIILLSMLLVGLIIAYVIKNSNGTNEEVYEIAQTNGFSEQATGKGQKQEKKTTLKQNSEIKSALTEKIEPHATYHLEEVYVEENQFVEKGANILKYTNGTYLTAPYDCVVTELSLPETSGKLLNSHYIQISSNNVLSVTVNIDEANINKVNVGQEAKISIATLEKEYSGYITNVSSTASNGKFKATIEFENDGNIKLGMTANVEITI